jgi:hypothetical protein
MVTDQERVIQVNHAKAAGASRSEAQRFHKKYELPQ